MKDKTTNGKGRKRIVRKGHANGCGTLEKRGGVWLARWVVDGKRFAKSTGTGDRREAEKILAELVAPTQAKSEKERLENVAAKIAGREAEIKRFEDGKPALAVDKAFDAYARHPDAPDTGAATLEMYDAQYRRFLKWLPAHYPEVTELRQVSKPVAYAFLEELKGQVSANSYNKIITLYRRIWKVLDESARLEGLNPWATVKMRKVEDGVRRELTPAELVRIGQTAKGELALLFAIGIYTGLRLGDAVRLDWSSVDLPRRCITVIPSKTRRYAHGKPVKIPIVAPFASMLATVPQSDRVGPLCPELAATYRHDSADVSLRVQRVFKDCGIETHAETAGAGGRARVAVGFHSLRHTFVTIAAEHGVPLAIVQAVVGHTSPAMTRHYLHVSEEAAQRHLAVFPDVFAPAVDGAPVAVLENPANAPVEVEAVVVESVGLDTATLAKLDALRTDGETRADVVRRAVALLEANGGKAV